MTALAIHLGGSSGSQAQDAVRPQPPRNPVSITRYRSNPQVTITVYIVESQEQADELETEATLGATNYATVGPLGIDARRQYVIGDGPDTLSQIESTRQYVAFLNADSDATGSITILQIIDVRSKR
jgi:hypothetical protein